MLWDVEEKDGPGAYGEGLAAPLGVTAFLPQLQGPLVFTYKTELPPPSQTRPDCKCAAPLLSGA